MTASVSRRDFLKYTGAGFAVFVVGENLPWLVDRRAYAQTADVTRLNFTITDAIKDMGTHNSLNQAQCYFWVYKEANLPAECPGPHVFVTQGDTIEVTVTNALDENHSFAVPGLRFETGPIAPGQTVTASFTASISGTYLYYDNLNEPVNRMMGLHGALVVMPRAASGRRFTPYDNPPDAIQQLFDELGSTAWWPGLAWEQGDPATRTAPFRQYIWLLHQASPNLFAEVGDFTPGQDYPADQFVQKFLHDPFSPTRANAIPQYFTINGQSGHFAHNNPYINPNNRVGEPVLVRIINAGLWTHSMHLHANHFFVLNSSDAAARAVSGGGTDPGGGASGGTGGAAGGGTGGGTGGGGTGGGSGTDGGSDSDGGSDDGVAEGGGGGGGGLCFVQTLVGARSGRTLAQVVNGQLNPFPRGLQENLLWLDVFRVDPMDIVDYVIPYMRPPDIPNSRGIGRADPGLPTLVGSTTWPPNQELATLLPDLLSGFDQAGNPISLAVELSPLCYPMHDHSEPSQTSQGGNYNMGMIAGCNFTGDRNTPGAMNFPHQPLIGPPSGKGAFPTAMNPPWFDRG